MIRTRITRTAAVQIRGSTGPLWTHLYWPSQAGSAPPSLLVYFPDSPDATAEKEIRRLCRESGLIVLAAPTPYELADAQATVGWAADHAVELRADPSAVLIAGTGRGAAVAADLCRLAAEVGWPPLSLLELPEGTP